MKNYFVLGMASALLSLSAYSFVPNFNTEKTTGLKSSKKALVLENISVRDLIASKSGSSFLSGLEASALAKGEDGVIRLSQTHNGIRVYGSDLAFEVENGKIISRNGRVALVFLSSTKPAVSKQMALQIALRAKNSKFNSELVVYPTTEGQKLVWLLTEDAFDSQLNVFIDASNGDVLDTFNAMSHGHGAGSDGVQVNVDSTLVDGKYVLKTANRETYDAKNKGAIIGPFIIGLPGEIGTSLNDTWTDPAIVDAHNFAGSFITLLSEKFNRNSYDDKGAKVKSTVHFKKKFVNAFWNGKQMVYGDGDGKNASNLAGALDVVAHEISHAITTNTSSLIYKGESGALNESFSDIMAAYAEHMIQPNKADWLVGEDVWTPAISGDALRYMNNPNKDKRENPRAGREWAYSRDHMTDLYTGEQDNGGVHINSGICNLAFYLLSDGGVHPTQGGDSVVGVGIETAAKIAFKAFTTKLTSSSTFADAKAAMLAVAAKDFDAKTVSSVEAAWSAVGVK